MAKRERCGYPLDDSGKKLCRDRRVSNKHGWCFRPEHQTPRVVKRVAYTDAIQAALDNPMSAPDFSTPLLHEKTSSTDSFGIIRPDKDTQKNLEFAIYLAAQRMPLHHFPILATTKIFTRRVETLGMSEAGIMYINPDYFNAHPPEEAAGLLLHEIMHKYNLHHQHGKEFGITQETWDISNIAQDCEINQTILDLYGDKGISLPDGLCFPEKLGLEDHKSWDEYFLSIMRNEELRDKLQEEFGNSDPECTCEPDENEGQDGDNGGQDGQPGGGEDQEGDKKDKGNGQGGEDQGEGSDEKSGGQSGDSGEEGGEGDGQGAGSGEGGEAGESGQAGGSGDSQEEGQSGDSGGDQSGEPGGGGDGQSDGSGGGGSPDYKKKSCPKCSQKRQSDGHGGVETKADKDAIEEMERDILKKRSKGQLTDQQEGVASEMQEGHDDPERKLEEEKRAYKEDLAHKSQEPGEVGDEARRLLGEYFPPPKVNWRDELRVSVELTRKLSKKVFETYDTYNPLEQVANKVNSKIHKARGRPGKPRKIKMASRKSQAYAEVGICIDTSGSMSTDDLTQVASEIQAICKERGGDGIGMKLLPVDATVGECQVFSGVEDLDLTGGGGTDMGVGIEAMAKLRKEGEKIEQVIIMTDGHTPWPERPPSSPIRDYLVVLIGEGHASKESVPSWMRAVEYEPPEDS